MGLPNYLDYGKMYDMNPFAFQDAQAKVGLAQQFRDQKLQQEREAVRQKQLANVFDEQNNPIKLQQNQATLEGTRLTNRGSAVDVAHKEAMAPYKLSADQQKAVFEAKDSELKALEAEGYLLMQNPATRSQGQQLVDMSKHFVQLRAEHTNKQALEEQAQKNRVAIEELRAKRAKEVAAIQASRPSGGASGPFKQSTDQYRAALLARMEQARSAGDQETYNYLADQLQFVTDLRAAERPDTKAGAIDVPAVANMPAVPPRARPTAPGISKPTEQPKHSLADVQKMYPGVPPEKIKDAYKKKFGVDLQ